MPYFKIANKIAIGNRGKVFQTVPFQYNKEFTIYRPISPYNSPIIPGKGTFWTGRWRRVTNKNGM